MISKQEIESMMADGRLEEAENALACNIADDGGNAEWRYLRGSLNWRLGRRGNAMTDLEEAAALDPRSPASHLLDHYREIMDYFNPDMFNP